MSKLINIPIYYHNWKHFNKDLISLRGYQDLFRDHTMIYEVIRNYYNDDVFQIKIKTVLNVQLYFEESSGQFTKTPGYESFLHFHRENLFLQRDYKIIQESNAFEEDSYNF